MGVMAVMAGFTILRLISAFLAGTETFVLRTYYAVTVALFSFLPANAGLQAMLLAHGLAAIIMVLFALRLWERKNIFAIFQKSSVCA
jgi:hypothetical protein